MQLLEWTDPHLQVPRRRLPVTLCLDVGYELAAEVFAAPQSAHADGPQTVAELLAAEQGFLPVHDSASAQSLVVNRAALIWVGVDSADEAGVQPAAGRRCTVLVRLRGGVALRGTLCYLQPAERQRPVDYLNEDGVFFPLEVDGRWLLVNKGFVTRIDQTPPETADAGDEDAEPLRLQETGAEAELQSGAKPE